MKRKILAITIATLMITGVLVGATSKTNSGSHGVAVQTITLEAF